MPLTPEQIKAMVDALFSITDMEAVRAKISMEWRNADTGEGNWVTYHIEDTRIEPGKEVYIAMPQICAWCDSPATVEGGIFCDGCKAEYDAL